MIAIAFVLAKSSRYGIMNILFNQVKADYVERQAVMVLEDMDSKEILAQDRAHVWHPIMQHTTLEEKELMVIKEAKGTTITDSDGNVYLDGYGGLWNVNVGYGRQEIADAVYAQMQQLSYYSQTQAVPSAVALATRLAEMMPGDLNHVFFTNSGSESNETAFKIARQYGRQTFPGQNRYKIIARYRGYHGYTMGALSATGQVARREKFEPLVPGFLHVEPPIGVNNASDIEQVILREGPETVAAVIAEPVIGGGGILVPPDDYFPQVREICDRYGVLMILDEVITGFGRTGRLFGCEHWGVVPDIMTIAKGISSGYLPLGACVVTPKVFDAFLGEPGEAQEFSQVATYGGHPVCCAAALANLDIVMRERLWENSEKVGAYLLERLEGLDSPFVREVRGKGLMIAVDMMGEDGKDLDAERVGMVQAGIKEKGVLVGRMSHVLSPGPEHLLFLAPPLILTEQEADQIVGAFRNGLMKIS